jgi:hypothetical protein
MRALTASRAIVLVTTISGCSSPGSEPAAQPVVAGNGGSGGSAGAGVGGVSGSSAGSSGSAGSGTGGSAGAGGSPSGDCSTALPSSLFCAPLGPMPASILQTGLFPAAPDLTQHPASMLEYVPDPALWSDGMEKQRFVILPPSTKIDTSDRQRWVFPEGTIFVKTFFDDSGPGATPRAIETRLIRAALNGFYEFFVYQWNADGTDAALVVDDIEGNLNAELPVSITINRLVDGQPFTINAGAPFEHVLPSRNACGECHEKNGMVAQTFIGFDELRLNSKLTPDSASTQLQTFADAGLFTLPVPADPATISDASADDGRLLRIKRFVFGNCVTCHNGQGNVDFNPAVFVDNTVGKPTEAQSVMPPEGWLRVVPGDPETSVLYVQMQRTMLPEPEAGMNRLRPMPPLGVAEVAAEPSSLQDVYDWISALPH